MRAVFVNHCHPAMEHVCALRARCFAEAMSGRGHQVILLTETLPGGGATELETLPSALAGHDWSRPFGVAVEPMHDRILDAIRDGRLPWGVRQAAIAYRYFKDAGLFSDWRKAAQPYVETIAQAFEPDVIWATFGNTDTWNIAQDLARAAACPWVGDIKDNWQNFIPRGFRRRLAARYRDATHLTAFSEGQLREADLWFGREKTVLYSGFDEVLLQGSEPTPEAGFRIVLTGSIYHEENLAVLVRAIAAWVGTADRVGVGEVTFVYAGNEKERVERLTRPLEGVCRREIHGFLQLEALYAQQRSASINLYVRMPGKFIFHHKLFELLAAGQPAACFPEETDEALRLVADARGTFHSCRDEAALCQALDAAFSAAGDRPDLDRLRRYSWAGQAFILERVLGSARAAK